MIEGGKCGQSKKQYEMCGFGGVIGSKHVLHTEDFSSIASRVRHRGPDSCGIRIYDKQFNTATQGSHAIFFNRLAIIDLDPRSDQPFENDRYALVFNGEIYNYEELKHTLQLHGISFKTTSDTEVLFHCLNMWGKDAFTRINGMFSFLWLDKKEKKFIAARDRLGIKPLYYAINNGTFYCASELDSIVRMRKEAVSISHDAIEMYLWLQFVPTPYTAIEGINKLPPGCLIEGTMNGECFIQLSCYWDAYTNVTINQSRSNGNLENILRQSLQRQLHADVPLGLFLSSGVDSSLLAAMMNKYFASDNSVNFFTMQFEENTMSDESADAREFIQQFNNPNLHCHTIQINPNLVSESIDQLYDYYDEPFGDHASLLNWIISKKAREYVTVAISGDGADELFWGYQRYRRWKTLERISGTPFVPKVALTMTPLLSQKLNFNVKYVLEQDPVRRHFNLFLPSGMRYKLDKHIVRYPMWALNEVDKIKWRNDLPAILDLKTYLPDAMLYKVDRSSMASSLEVRVPYLDNEVIDYADSMPLSEKSTAAYSTKAPLKSLLKQLAPHYDIDRPKKGFNFPLQSWLKNNWKDRVLSAVTKDVLTKSGLDDEPYMRLVKEFYEGKNNYYTDVWRIYNLALWTNKVKSSSYRE